MTVLTDTIVPVAAPTFCRPTISGSAPEPAASEKPNSVEMVSPTRNTWPVCRPLTRGGFRTTWVKARDSVGLPAFRFHDLRHTGNALAAATGASTEELMARLGHASMRAALLHQHATADRDHAIAAGLSRRATGDVDDAEQQGRAGPPLPARGRARPRATVTERPRRQRSILHRSAHTEPYRL